MSCRAVAHLHHDDRAFFPGGIVLAMIGLYLFGILCGILYGHFEGCLPASRAKPVPFVMELPNTTTRPVPKVLCTHLEKQRLYPEGIYHHLVAGRNLVPADLRCINAFLNVVPAPESSLPAALGSILHHCFKLPGFADLCVSTALIPVYRKGKARCIHAGRRCSRRGKVQHHNSCLRRLPRSSFWYSCCRHYTPCVAQAIATVKRVMGRHTGHITTAR